MKFRETTQSDLDFVRQNPFEGEVKSYPYLSVPDANCYTVIFQEEIVAVGGMIILWEGVGELWLMLTKDSKKHEIYGLIALNAIENKINELIANNNVWRAQAIIRKDFPSAIKMVEALGFINETPEGMAFYLPDKGTAYLYVKIRRPNGHER